MKRGLALVSLSFALVMGCGETFELEPDMAATMLKDNGVACGGGAECTSGRCNDGVCCATACDGVCEACNLPGQLGTCAPIPNGTDPQMECMPKPLNMGDGGVQDGGTQFNIPDAGFNAMQGPCAPKCNGQRACGFPGESVKCGDSFCNTNTAVANAVCDGEGHCSLQETACVAYTCGPDACKSSCTSNADCQDDFFCNGSGVCQAKKGQGIACNTPTECQSGYCADGVCCNSNCGMISGGKCNNPGFVGICKCTVNNPYTAVCDGTCEMYYPDGDTDGYGKINGAPIVGCTADPNNDPPPPSGYVLDHTDCADDDVRVHPGAGPSTATNWTTGQHTPAFDWDCDGNVTYKHPIYTGYNCYFCNPSGYSPFLGGGASCGGVSSTSAYDNQRAYMNCSKTETAQCSGSGFCILSYCCGLGCHSTNGMGTDFLRYDDHAFVSGGGCGQSGTLRVCGTGGAAGTTASGQYDYSDTQTCQ